ncbi:MAG: glycosyltransferase family 87 protein [Alphaproteobacteria bacterium]|nr:glycosyltransferase family 87 protein [Alphaproteobacteria bacterium]
MNSFLTPWRLKWYPRLLLLALAVGFAIGVLGGQGAATLSGRLGGDFAEFYAAGRMVAGGQGVQLYEAQAQQEAQRDLHPDEAGAFVPFVYPPFLAAIYAPLSFLPYRLAFILHTFLMLAALVGALKLFIQAGLDQSNAGAKSPLYQQANERSPAVIARRPWPTKQSSPAAGKLGTGSPRRCASCDDDRRLVSHFIAPLLSRFLQRTLSCQRRLASHLSFWVKGRPQLDLTKPITPDLFLLLFTAALLFYPVFCSILGGQNTALTLLLAAWWVFALRQGQAWRAGVPLGLLLFKPQFALPLIALSFLAGRWRTVVTALGLGIVFAGVSGLIAGPHWPQAWFAYATWAMPLDTALAGEQLVGWLGFFQSVWGVDAIWSFRAGLVASLATASFLAFLWFRVSRRAVIRHAISPATSYQGPDENTPDVIAESTAAWRSSPQLSSSRTGLLRSLRLLVMTKEGGLVSHFISPLPSFASFLSTSKAASVFPDLRLVAATLAGLVLLSPHALFYDAGLLLPALWLWLQEPAPKAPHAVALLWLCGFTQLAAPVLGFSPLFFLSLGVFLFSALKVARQQLPSRDPRSEHTSP